MERKIGVVVFDIGNVVLGWDPYLPLAHELTRLEWEEFVQEADFFGLNLLADLGAPLEAVVEQAAARRARHGRLMRSYYERFDQALTGPVAGVSEIISELKAAGFTLLGLSNWSAETLHHAWRRAPVLHHLEGAVISGREGIAKPDPAIFRLLIERYQITPQKTVFIDDTAPNVDAASALEMTGLHFTTAAQLRSDLRRWSVFNPR